MLNRLRELYGEVYVTSFPNGIDVPWKPLSYGDFIHYTDLFQEGRTPSAIIEDEIFKKSVVQSTLVRNLDWLNAGIVSTVAANVMELSGPSQVEQFNEALDAQRLLVDNPLHFAVTIICRAFPSYKPEDIYKLDYQTVMLRLAQAERMLIDAKILTEPIRLYSENESAQPVKKEAPEELKRAWEHSMKFKDLNPKPEAPQKPVQKKQSPRVIPPNIPKVEAAKPPADWNTSISPALQKSFNVDIKKENALINDASSGARSGWDIIDEPLVRNQMVADAKIIYKDLLEKLAAKKKV